MIVPVCSISQSEKPLASLEVEGARGGSCRNEPSKHELAKACTSSKLRLLLQANLKKACSMHLQLASEIATRDLLCVACWSKFLSAVPGSQTFSLLVSTRTASRTLQDLMELFCARQRRKFSRGIKRKPWT